MTDGTDSATSQTAFWPNGLIKRKIRRLLGDRISPLISIEGLKLKAKILLFSIVIVASTSSSTSQTGLDAFNGGKSGPPTDLESEDSGGLKGLIYARVSSNEQVKDSDEADNHEGSIDDQIAELLRIAKQEGIEIIHEPILDKAQTGTNFRREGIQKVFRMANREEVDYVLAQEIDRIGRCAPETLYFIYLLQAECNVTLVTASGEQDLDTIHGLMHTTLLSLMAEVQNEIRTTKAKKSRVRGFLEHKNWSSYSPSVPLGYTETEDGWLKTDASEERIVQDLFEMFLECETYAETRRLINEEHGNVLQGHKTKTLLQQPAYIGKPQLPDEWVVDMSYDGVVDAPELQIIEESTFQEVQDLIEQKNTKHSTSDEVYEMADFIEEFDLFTVISSSEPATLLHDCGSEMVKDGQQTLKGGIKTHRYRCKKCDKTRKWPRENEYDRMEIIYDILEGSSRLLEFLE